MERMRLVLFAVLLTACPAASERAPAVHAVGVETVIPSIPERATPDYIGPGAAGVCGLPAPTELVTVTFELDVPSPRCLVVTGNQRLRMINRFAKHAVGRLGKVEFVVPARGSVILDRPFRDYLMPGGYFLKTNLYSGGSGEIRYER